MKGTQKEEEAFPLSTSRKIYIALNNVMRKVGRKMIQKAFKSSVH